MIAIYNWMTAVVKLFDRTLRALLGESFFSVLLEALVFLIVVSLISTMHRAVKKV